VLDFYFSRLFNPIAAACIGGCQQAFNVPVILGVECVRRKHMKMMVVVVVVMRIIMMMMLMLTMMLAIDRIQYKMGHCNIKTQLTACSSLSQASTRRRKSTTASMHQRASPK
jgi:hypothetical protein